MKFERRIAIAPVVIIIVVIIVIAAGAGAYYLATSSGSTPTSTTTTSSTSTSSTTTATTTAPPSSTTTTTPTTSAASSTTTSSTTSSSLTTTSSTTPSSSTTTSTTSYSTFSCTSTTSTTTGTIDYTPQYIALIKGFSAMEFKVSGITGGSSGNETFGYTVTSSSGGIYNGNINTTSSGGNFGVSFVVDSNNNTVLSVTVSGYSITGAQAKTEFDDFMALFGLEYTYGGALNVYTDSAYFHSTGPAASMTFGTVTFPVTTYVANSLPLTVNECGVSSTITAFTLEVGTPPGTSLQFITLLHFASSAPTTEDITFQLVSMTAG